MYQLIFHPEANVDFIEASVWYEKQQLELGSRFASAIGKTLDRIQKNPDFFRIIKQNFREASVPVFPYTMFIGSISARKS